MVVTTGTRTIQSTNPTLRMQSHHLIASCASLVGTVSTEARAFVGSCFNVVMAHLSVGVRGSRMRRTMEPFREEVQGRQDQVGLTTGEKTRNATGGRRLDCLTSDFPESLTQSVFMYSSKACLSSGLSAVPKRCP